MRLDPDQYVCPEHDVNLTERVATQLSQDPSIVVGFSVAQSSRRKKAVEEPFLVVVSCPGTKDGPHDVECSGSYSDE